VRDSAIEPVNFPVNKPVEFLKICDLAALLSSSSLTSPVVKVAVIGLGLTPVAHVLASLLALALPLGAVEPRRRVDTHPVLTARLRVVLVGPAHT
jgi:hypothetical protein